MSIKLSVIIPVYKVETYLRECVDSVLFQSLKDLEVILVDDGSPDSCPIICDQYASENKNVKVIHKKNGGLSDARNCGLMAAEGEYVAFLDSDDFYNDRIFLQEATNKLQKEHSDLLMFQRQYYLDEKKEYLGKPRIYGDEIMQEEECGELFYLLAKADQLDASASMKIIRRNILIDNRLFFKTGILSEDVEWFFRLAPCVSSVSVINEIAYVYRRREGSITNIHSVNHVRDMVSIVIEYAELYEKHRGTKDKKILAMMNYLAYQYYITLGLVWNCLDDRQKDLRQLEQYRWLADYSISRKTRLAAFALKILRGRVYRIFGRYIVGK